MTFNAPLLLSRAELIDASLVFTKRYFVPILHAALPALVLGVAVDVALLLLTPDSDSLLEMFVELMVWGLAEGMAFAACWDIVHGNTTTPGRAWTLVAPRLGAIVAGYTLKWVFIIVGLFLLIAPGVYLIALYFAVPPASVAEQASLRQAFRRSRALARPELKRIMMTLGTFQVAVLLVSTLITGAVSGWSMESSRSAIQTVVAWAFGIAILPLGAALTTLLYLDIRMRKEGYDLQSTLDHLHGAAAR